MRAERDTIEVRVGGIIPGLALNSSEGQLLRLMERLAGRESPQPVQVEPRAVGTESRYSVPRFDLGRDRLFSSFELWQGQGNNTRVLGTNHFVDQFSDVSKWNYPFPNAASKKGLQVQMVPDALALGIKHAALNVNLTGLIALDGTNGIPWDVDGKTVRFQSGALRALDDQVRPLAESNVVISLILLTYASGQAERDRLMLHPRYERRAPNHLGAFNTVTEEGATYFRGCLEFLAEHYSQPQFNGRVVNFILGNEVNSHWFWANMGEVTMEEFAKDYLRTARLAATALRKLSRSARLYLSLEHHWGMRYPGGNERQAFSGRPFLEYFARHAREQGDFEWHVAFHPYPENLFEPRTWRDRSATSADDSPRITFKNLEVLPRFLHRPELLFQGHPRRIILSEQGFHTVNKPEGELWQAAGYAYAYYKVDQLEDIDAFILHRHVDHRDEGGLLLGLWTRKEQGAATPDRPKRIYEVFRQADTPSWREAFAFALPIIGIKDWAELR